MLCFRVGDIKSATVSSQLTKMKTAKMKKMQVVNLLFLAFNLFAHNNKSQICYCDQISLRSAAVNCSFLKPLKVTFISLAMVHLIENFTYTCINSSTYSTSLNKLEDLRNVFLSRVFEKINIYKTLLCAVSFLNCLETYQISTS